MTLRNQDFPFGDLSSASGLTQNFCSIFEIISAAMTQKYSFSQQESFIFVSSNNKALTTAATSELRTELATVNAAAKSYQDAPTKIYFTLVRIYNSKCVLTDMPRRTRLKSASRGNVFNEGVRDAVQH